MSNNIIKVLIKSLLVNFSLTVLKITTGIIGRSQALIADGVHSFSDLGTDILSIASSKLATKPADNKHPFGHGKIEYLCCIAISLIVFSLGLVLGINALKGKRTVPSMIVLYTTIFTIIAKYLLARYLIKKGLNYHNSLLSASGKESMADAVSSVVVLISFIGSKLAKYNELFIYSDMIGALILSVIILITGVRIFIMNLASILGEKETNPEIINYVNEIIYNTEDVKKIDSLILLKFGTYYKCDLVLYLDSNMKIKESNKIIKKLRSRLINDRTTIKYLNISVKPYQESK